MMRADSPSGPFAGARRAGRRTLLLAGIAAGLLLLAACAASPEIRYFRVEYPLPGPSANSPLPLTLGIARLAAPEPYRQERISYRTSPYQVQSYTYARWEAPPVDMVHERLLEQCAASGRFRRVVPWRRGDVLDYHLEARLRRFEELDEADGWYGLVELEYELVDREGKSLLREVMSRRVRVEARTMDGVVEALSRGLRTGLDEVVAKTAAALAGQRPGS
jgi:ABC-type uncharacterized transport system auxiliary subunit